MDVSLCDVRALSPSNDVLANCGIWLTCDIHPNFHFHTHVSRSRWVITAFDIQAGVAEELMMRAVLLRLMRGATLSGTALGPAIARSTPNAGLPSGLPAVRLVRRLRCPGC